MTEKGELELVCICGEKETVKRIDTIKPEFEWKKLGSKWSCPKCQKDPSRLKDIIEGKAAPKIEPSEPVDEFEELRVVEQVYVTKDRAQHKTSEDASKHIDDMIALRKLDKQINDPVHFNNVQLMAIIANIDEIYKIIKGEEEV
jgi:rubredoxin